MKSLRLSMLCLSALLAFGMADGRPRWISLLRADEPEAAPATKEGQDKPAEKSSARAQEDEEEPPLDAPAGKPPSRAKGPPEKQDLPAEKNVPTEQSPVDKERSSGQDQSVYDTVYRLDRDGKERSFRTALYPDWLELPAPPKQMFTFRLNNGPAEKGPSVTVAGSKLKRIDYYELRMLRSAAEQLNLDPQALTDPGTAVDLSQLAPERIERAEKLLITAAAQHESAVQQNRRRGTAWASHVRQPLAAALFNLRLGEIDRLIAGGKNQAAQALCDRTHAELHESPGARNAALRRRYETILLVPAEAAIEGRDFKTAYPILECGYAELPRNFAPPNVLTPPERHASALLFESLTRWTDDPRTGPHYASQLAEGTPLSLARGRQFRLPQTPPAKWSDYSDAQPYFCTVADVSWTIKLLQSETCPGYSAAAGRLIGGEADASDDAFTAAIRLQRDYWQPLSLMEFPVLPRHCFPAGGSKEEWAAFNAAPVGSGPYRLAERTDDRVQFVAQPHYRFAGRPKIREINFHRLAADEMVDEILKGRIQLAYGLTAKQVDRLAEGHKRVQKLRPRSVWFLAPNYRRPSMKNQELRLALAHAIDRRSILDKAFRPQGHADDHAELSGPFPHGSWASHGDAPAFDIEQARAFAVSARRELGQLTPLKLVYPPHDADAEDACRQIQLHAGAIDIQIAPEAAQPGDFGDRILRRRDFDLVYWRHDYADETYELWPLFDPGPAAQAAGGANFMGAVPDAPLAGFFRELALHKRYSDIRALMHKIHDHVARTAAIIPLWQLDAYVAIDDSLAGIALDRNVLFGDVQNWELESP